MARSAWRRRAALLAGTSCLLVAGAADAQTAHPKPAAKSEAAAQLSLGRIVVSAGAEKVAIDTPQAVTALDQEDIDQTQATTVGDLLEAMPGVSAVGGVSALGQGFNIRGLGTGLADSDSRILTQIDGVTKFYEQYRMGALFTEPELYKRVEVLRGPASSTLYGAGALAGVINFTTKDASDFLTEGDTFTVRLRGGYETNSNGRFGSVIAAVKPSDNLDLLAVYTAREADHYESGDGKTVVPSNATSSSCLLKGRYNIGGDKGHNLWASYQNWLSDSVQIYDQAEAFGTTPVRRKVDDDTAVVGYENDFGGSKVFDLKAQVSFADSKVEQRETTFLPGVIYSEFSYKTRQARIENTSRFDMGPDWTGFLFVGLQAYQQERRNPRTTAAGTVTPGAATHPEGDMDKYGAFAQAELIWSDKLTIIPGVRVDKSRLKPGAGVTTRTVVEDTAASPKIAVMYALTDQISVFGSAARTVRMPVLDEIYSRTSAAASNFNLNLEPEESDNYEVGATLSLDGVFAPRDAIRVKATAFRNDVSNLITRGAVGAPYFVNVGESRFSGVEIEAEYASRGLFARAGLAMIDGENEITGLPLNTIPADELDLTVGYRFAERGVTLGWRGEFAADQEEVATAALRTGGYGVHNLFLTWKPQDGALEGLEVRLAVDDLLDKQFRRHLSSLDAEGRTFKFALARTF
ncbi:TonB-dependent receptor domain-containing protein [Phenylobacterium sp.]|uniref:TonB-dependent receptor domain-containing protein n=1 Tax=Phenylobacterium sp. TaxID=1871053 RepID=UPI002735BBD4|nr:TonB-dependent receptor [Phenylobacterium sp.]MDP3854099.1 TonB-dependent receptor [Phenylobacterium sp.]